MTWRLGRAQALLAVMLLLGSPSLAEEYHVDVTYNISVGHAMRLPCDDVENGESRNVMWRRKGGVPMDTDAGVEVRGNAIWFLPAQAKHSGVYECNGTYPFHIQLNVDSGSCPEADFDVGRTLHTSGILNCRVNHISRFINTTITWLKECKPLEKDHIFIKPTQLRLKSVEKTDAGNYTCVLHFNREGRNYTSARTTRLQVHVITEPSKPQIIVPANETRVVKMGSRQELRCEVIAVSDEFTTVMWNISDSDSDSDFNISKVDIEGRHVTTLTIFKVQPKFLEVPFLRGSKQHGLNQKPNTANASQSQKLLLAGGGGFSVWTGDVGRAALPVLQIGPGAVLLLPLSQTAPAQRWFWRISTATSCSSGAEMTRCLGEVFS